MGLPGCRSVAVVDVINSRPTTHATSSRGSDAGARRDGHAYPSQVAPDPEYVAGAFSAQRSGRASAKLSASATQPAGRRPTETAADTRRSPPARSDAALPGPRFATTTGANSLDETQAPVVGQHDRVPLSLGQAGQAVSHQLTAAVLVAVETARTREADSPIPAALTAAAWADAVAWSDDLDERRRTCQAKMVGCVTCSGWPARQCVPGAMPAGSNSPSTTSQLTIGPGGCRHHRRLCRKRSFVDR